MRLVRSPSSATPTIHTPPLRFARLRNPVTGFELDFTHDFRNQTDQQPPQAARENVTDFGSQIQKLQQPASNRLTGFRKQRRVLPRVWLRPGESGGSKNGGGKVRVEVQVAW